MSERDLEDYFDSRYGPIRNCKIAKDSTNGRSKTYGYVLFKEGRHANAAMLDSKAGNTEFTMDWYTILAQRPSVKSTNN
jgi:RNA recognition motif-containing protein